MVVYIDQFTCNEDIANQFSGYGEWCGEKPDSTGKQSILGLLNSSVVLLAWYGGGSLDGQAMVVYRTKEGQLYEVNGSHCSCYGLEGRWDPEETNYKALAMRDPSNIDSDLDFIEAYKEMLEILKDNK